MTHKIFSCILAILLTLNLSAQVSKKTDLRLPMTKQEVKTMNPNLVFFYDAQLKSSDGKYKASGFDLGFYTNTYEILEANGLIDSIFVADNEKQMADIDAKTWIYCCEFNIDKSQLKKDLAILNIENLDGNCALYINKKLVRNYNNSFMQYRQQIKPFLKKGKNNIELVFTPKDSIRVNQRAPQYLYGWDWHPTTLAPKINAIYLTFEDDIPYLEAKYIQTKKIEGNKAYMTLNLKFSKPLDNSYTLRMKPKQFLNHHTLDRVFDLQANETGEYSIDFEVENPVLWWPNGAGMQEMYTSELYLVEDRLSLGDISFGIRTIELMREKDEYGESFYFKVNDRPIFAKGANIILTPQDKDLLLSQAAIANMNMLRIWGGSDYGDDAFYESCDRYGIMVWQDFPFSTELYPADSEYLANVRQEAIQNVQRISGHPSLALYCGNNEIWEGWWNWGWKQSIADTSHVVEDYDKIFRELLPEVVQKYSPEIGYIHSSPVEYGWGHEESRRIGDSHYYGVWWADSAFDAYAHKIPRFMSEYGFQSVMNQSTADKYCTHPYTKDNEGFAIHQKHDRGFELVDNRIHEWFGPYNTDEDYFFYSQATQQEGMKIAIEAHRRNKPYCMGTLFWQLNEPYPCVGWGCIDFSGEEKPLYYTAMKGFESVIFSIDTYSHEDSVYIYACSDVDHDITLKYRLKILTDSDSLRYSYIQTQTDLQADATKLLAALAYKDIKGFNPKTDYLWIDGFYEGTSVSNYHFFVFPKDYVSMEKYLNVIFRYYFPNEQMYIEENAEIEE